jgi:uncharacterized protein with PIN domain
MSIILQQIKKLSELDSDSYELFKLIRLRQDELDNQVITPECCHEIKTSKLIILSLDNYDDTTTSNARWVLNGHDLKANYMPTFCPYCGTKLPKIKRKAHISEDICVITDGGYYCDTCQDRLNNCLCDLPQTAFEIDQ